MRRSLQQRLIGDRGAQITEEYIRFLQESVISLGLLSIALIILHIWSIRAH